MLNAGKKAEELLNYIKKLKTNNMAETAVSWFMGKIGEKQPNGLYVIDTLEDVQNVFEQAKEMEKEQMYKCASFWRGKENEIEKPIFDEYYKETYNK